MSWGFDEFPEETSYDSSFTVPGITYIAASGDGASVDYPAASPDVLAVGGTTLNLDSSGVVQSEAGWNESGGGYSLYESEPAYQQSVQSTGQRSTPDVAFDADPNTGVAVYETPPSGGGGRWGQATSQGSWQVVGGTSLGAPAWAGIIAIVDQGRALTGLASLGGATQTLPSLYQAAASDFRSVTATQPNSPLLGNGGGFPWGGFGSWGDGAAGGTATTTGATANTQTGIGSPGGSSLVNDLAASTLTEPLPTPTPAPRQHLRRLLRVRRSTLITSGTSTNAVGPRPIGRRPTPSGLSPRTPRPIRTNCTHIITGERPWRRERPVMNRAGHVPRGPSSGVLIQDRRRSDSRMACFYESLREDSKIGGRPRHLAVLFSFIGLETLARRSPTSQPLL